MNPLPVPFTTKAVVTSGYLTFDSDMAVFLRSLVDAGATVDIDQIVRPVGETWSAYVEGEFCGIVYGGMQASGKPLTTVRHVTPGKAMGAPHDENELWRFNPGAVVFDPGHQFDQWVAAFEFQTDGLPFQGRLVVEAEFTFEDGQKNKAEVTYDLEQNKVTQTITGPMAAVPS